MKFRMVDRIVEWQPYRMIRGVKAVSFEEYELNRLLGDEPCLPETLLLESLFQLGNWLVMLSTDFQQMGLVLRFEEVRFSDRLRPGQSLSMEAVVRTWREDGLVFDGHGRTNKETIITGHGCMALPVALTDYLDPADLRVLFTEIYRPQTSLLKGLP